MNLGPSERCWDKGNVHVAVDMNQRLLEEEEGLGSYELEKFDCPGGIVATGL